jgi:hypothetical protein
VVFGAEAVVDERTVVVVVVRAFVADRAVERCFRFDHLVEDAQVVQMNVLIQKIVNEPDKVVFRGQVAWAHKYRQQEGCQRNHEKDYRHRYADLFEQGPGFDMIDEAKPVGHDNDHVASEPQYDDARGPVDLPDGPVSLEANTLAMVFQNELQTFVLQIFKYFFALNE